MKTIKHILVCLDLTDIDKHLIHYASLAARVFHAEAVTFIHVIQAYDLPNKSSKSFPDVKSSLNAMIRDELDNRIDEKFRKSVSTRIETRVAEEDAAEDILCFAGDMDTDLLLIGQKYGEDRQKRYGGELSANSKCDILFVPEDPPLEIARVFCGLDYSRASKAAFDRALHLHHQQNAHLVCYFIQDSTRSYFPASTRKSASQHLSRAETRHQEFMAEFGLEPESFPCRIDASEDLISEGEKLYNAAEDDNADLIIVGAAGDTATETSLLGNITETLRRMEKAIPVMIVKDRENKKFFSNLLS
ncbi:nucleotide-binding universal stress UspA family protein [Desulfosalsimonas propionicica]|uniref:Nucleotide-binding universal stress UspA family protein n=1 Tax=Desulfosalsimonas propionicica TaxID=332175 RepID=A0A7W0HM19_9BACT|nr:universal stress protein [Desulfosalsimonas propionicica]MBA2882905.1 nucleotide-binding universal stress UspA family protein [Desulfosalsimonas propionicica]